MSVLCIGSAVVDIAASPVSQSQEWKEKQRISDISIHAGGDAVNQSLMLSMLGEKVYLSCAAGHDENGIYLQSILRSRGVSTEYVREHPDVSTGTSLVLVDENGERHAFSVHGAHSTYKKADTPEIWELAEKKVCAVSLASIFSFPEFESDGLLEFLKETKKQGILVFADLASDKKKQGLEGVRRFLPYIDYFLPSEYDAFSMTGKSDVKEASQVYHSCGAEHVIIKRGAEGCFYSGNRSDTKTSGYVPAIKTAPVDTTGAGDAMNAFFIHEILKGASLEQACQTACICASYTTLFPGASSEQITLDGVGQWLNQWGR